MRASLRLEAIGDDLDQHLRITRAIVDRVVGEGGSNLLLGRWPARYWAAEITGFDSKFGYARTFLRGKKDYSDANGVGSRGVYVYYILESGHVYEVLRPKSWGRSIRYFCTVSETGEIVTMTKDEVNEWLKNGKGRLG